MNDLDNELVKEFKDYCEQVLAKDIEIMKRFSELTGITTLKELWKIGTYPSRFLMASNMKGFVSVNKQFLSYYFILYSKEIVNVL